MSLIRHYSSKLQFIITATVLGNVLQWFDFSLFGMMLPLFMKVFFPGRTTSFFLILYAFGVFARPIGGLVFGYLGDTHGRKVAIVRTITLMTIPIFLVSILPSYSEIGITASILISALYLFQGFCVGGEFPGSIVFIMESAPSTMRAYLGIWPYFGAILGMLLVALDLFWVDQNLSSEALEAWGWRLPFFMGTLIGVIGVFMRHFLHETPIFQEAKKVGHLVHKPILATFQKHSGMLLKGMGIYILDAFSFNLVIIYSGFYFVQYLELSLTQSFRINAFSVLLIVVLLPFMAKLAAFIGNIRFAKLASLAIVLLAAPLYWLILQKTLLAIYIGQGLLCVIVSCYICNMPAILYQLFPTQVRFTCLAVTINFTVALFGGTSLLIANYFMNLTHLLLIPAIYLSIGALISFFSLTTLKEQVH